MPGAPRMEGSGPLFPCRALAATTAQALGRLVWPDAVAPPRLGAVQFPVSQHRDWRGQRTVSSVSWFISLCISLTPCLVQRQQRITLSAWPALAGEGSGGEEHRSFQLVIISSDVSFLHVAMLRDSCPPSAQWWGGPVPASMVVSDGAGADGPSSFVCGRV